MKMKKSASFLFVAAFLSITALAQNVQEGVNDIYAERYQSAKSVFDKLIAANPNNMEATYWLGQDYMAMNNLPAARALYEKSLASNGNAPLIMAGMGHVELAEGNSSAARQHFDGAIAASHGKKGGDPAVLNAVARANIDVYTDSKKIGDLDYAISKLNEAVQVNPNNPETYLNLGNAYRKKHDGSNAAVNYRKAKQLSPNFAIADYRVAQLFLTQTTYGQGNWDVVLENLNNAIAADPRFAPAYLELYYYHLLYKKDFPTAETYANKYIANSDPSPDNDYVKMQTLFVENKFPEAISIGKNIIAQTNNNAKARVYKALAYSYLGTKDTTSACDAANQYFAKAKEEEIIGPDYIMHAEACDKGNPEVLQADIIKAVSMDSVLSRQIALLNDEITKASNAQQRGLEAQLMLTRYNLLGSKANPAELVSIGIPFYQDGNLQKADSLFQVYNKTFPDSIYGYLWDSRVLTQMDTAWTQGLPVPAYEQLLRVAETDKVRFKSYGMQAAANLAIYYVNIKKDKEKGIYYLNKGLEFDPTNESFKSNIAKLEKQSSAPARSSSGTKPKAGKGK